jgi:hypothetical protein
LIVQRPRQMQRVLRELGVQFADGHPQRDDLLLFGVLLVLPAPQHRLRNAGSLANHSGVLALERT